MTDGWEQQIEGKIGTLMLKNIQQKLIREASLRQPAVVPNRESPPVRLPGRMTNNSRKITSSHQGFANIPYTPTGEAP